jgi:hypothetical protein
LGAGERTGLGTVKPLVSRTLLDTRLELFRVRVQMRPEAVDSSHLISVGLPSLSHSHTRVLALANPAETPYSW